MDGVDRERLADGPSKRRPHELRAILLTRRTGHHGPGPYGDMRRPCTCRSEARIADDRLLLSIGADPEAASGRTRRDSRIHPRACERGYDEILAIIREEEERRKQTAEANSTAPPSTRDELLDAMVQGNPLQYRPQFLEREPSVSAGARCAEEWLRSIGPPPGECRLSSFRPWRRSCGAPERN